MCMQVYICTLGSSPEHIGHTVLFFLDVVEVTGTLGLEIALLRMGPSLECHCGMWVLGPWSSF